MIAAAWILGLLLASFASAFCCGLAVAMIEDIVTRGQAPRGALGWALASAAGGAAGAVSSVAAVVVVWPW